MHPVGFEPTISAGEWPQTYALDRAATGTGNKTYFRCRNKLQLLIKACVKYVNLKQEEDKKKSQ